MKVLCDVCKGEEAAVYCCADEAALCGACDARVHRANKLAGKHRRFSLLHPTSPQQFPLCDICQEKRALLFCQEDRAIICRDCDSPIHTANELTKKHSRFLLTGVKLSPSATLACPAVASSDCPASVAVSSSTSEDEEEPPGDVTTVNHRSHLGVDGAAKQQKKAAAAAAPVAAEVSDKNGKGAAGAAAGFGNGGKVMVQDKSPFGSTSPAAPAAPTAGGSSISEYLIKELPGWHVEDLLLDASPGLSPAIFNFSKMTGEDLMLFQEADLDAVAFPTDDGGNSLSAWWVPQVPQVAPSLRPLPASHDYGQQRLHAIATGVGGDLNKPAVRQLQQQFQQQQQQQLHHHRWATSTDDCFTVPEIPTVQPHSQHNPPSYKRARSTSWCMS